MKTKIEIVSDWQDYLIWCPSQCYLRLIFEGRYFVLYLRWRGGDPWSGTLIECDSDFYMHNEKYEWYRIELSYWKDSELDKCKDEALKICKELIYNRIEV